MRVLIAANGSEHSQKAVEFAAGILSDAAQVRLVDIAGYEFNPDTPEGPLTQAQERLSQSSKHDRKTVGEPTRSWKASKADVSNVRRSGHPAEEILLEAAEWGADLIVVGHHDRPASWFYGSVAEALVKILPCQFSWFQAQTLQPCRACLDPATGAASSARGTCRRRSYLCCLMI